MTAGHKYRPEELHHPENEGRTDTEQQHTIERFQGTHHPPVLFQHQPRSASRGHRIDGLEDRILRRCERVKPQLRRRPQRGLYPVQHSQQQSERTHRANHDRERTP